jgi:hypothetical protein
MEYSTRTTAQWRFRSAHLDDTTRVALPLSVVRFAPTVDDRGTAPAGILFPVPVFIQRQAASGAAPNVSLRIEISYDDGASWTGVPVRRHDGATVALLTHPVRPASVSLRAWAVDADGNSVRETILRAYRTAARPMEP